MRYAIVEGGRVMNVVESDEALFDNWIESASASIGDVFDGESFGPPPITASDIGARRYQVETAGVIWQGFGIATDDRSQTKLQAERAAAKDGLRTDGSAWKCLDLESGAITFRPTKNDEIIEIADQAYRYIAACYAREEALLAIGEAVTAQDLEEGWPANG